MPLPTDEQKEDNTPSNPFKQPTTQVISPEKPPPKKQRVDDKDEDDHLLSTVHEPPPQRPSFHYQTEYVHSE